MPIYRVEGPDGRIHRFEGPPNATPEEVEAFAKHLGMDPVEDEVSI